MSSQTVITFFAVALIGGSIALVVAAFAPQIRGPIAASALPLAALVAVGASLGSLYLSEVANYVPCELCWYQRIAMYPMAVLLPLAAWRKDPNGLVYAGALAAVGLVIAGYHIQLQLFPEQSSFCAVANPCTASPAKALGALTIPQMSALAFVLIGALALFDRTSPQEVQP